MNNNTREELKKAGFVKVSAYEYYEDDDEPQTGGRVVVTKIKRNVYTKIISDTITCAVEAHGLNFKVYISNLSYTLTKIVKCEEHNLLVEVNLLLGKFSRLVNDHD